MRYQINSPVGFLIWLGLVLTFVFSSLFTVAQTNSNSQLDSTLSQSKFDKKEKYVGYTLAFGLDHFKLSSNIPELDGHSVSREGGNAGMMLGNRIGMLKSTVGLYYSTMSSPYSFEVAEATVSANVYLLRLKSVRPHTIEPYASVSTKGMRTSINGNYYKEGKMPNNSISEEPRIGVLSSFQTSFGLGAEYQLENENNNYIHFFTEIRYGLSSIKGPSDKILEQTTLQNIMSFRLGLHFGNIKR